MMPAAELALRLEIAALNQRYCHAADRGDGEAWAACYAEDGVFDRYGGETQGREALRRVVRSSASVKRRHYFFDPIVELTSETEARGAGYGQLVAFDVGTQTWAPTVYVDYTDTYRLTPEGWRIARREIRRSFGESPT